MFVRIACCFVIALHILAASAFSKDNPLTGAAERIEKHRMADATVLVVDSSGKPIPGAMVTVEQTRHAFLFGCNIYKWGKAPDEKTEAAYRRQYEGLLNYATLGFYWASYERKEGRPEHEYAGNVADWCKQKNIATKGHPLAWNHSDPRWLPDDSGTVRRLQMERIDDCVKRFRGKIDRWDVVNEATHFDRPDMLRRAPKQTAMWRETGNVKFIKECFKHARAANPEATLLINDYRNDVKYERLIEKLVDAQGKPIYDVIGMQSHMHAGVWPDKMIWDVCERFGRFGVPLHFTETTILSGKSGWNLPRKGWDTQPEGEARQAREVVRFYAMLFAHPAVEAITWWDFSDHQAWKGAPAGFLRKDMSPKPAYEALCRHVKGDWWTRTTARTGAGGSATVRAFLGDYRVTATAGGKTATVEAACRRDQANAWAVRLA